MGLVFDFVAETHTRDTVFGRVSAPSRIEAYEVLKNERNCNQILIGITGWLPMPLKLPYGTVMHILSAGWFTEEAINHLTRINDQSETPDYYTETW